MSKFLTVKQVANLSGFSRSLVLKEIKDGLLPSTRDPDASGPKPSHLIREEDARAWVELRSRSTLKQGTDNRIGANVKPSKPGPAYRKNRIAPSHSRKAAVIRIAIADGLIRRIDALRASQLTKVTREDAAHALLSEALKARGF